ncbi:pre-mRNA-splicing factor CWC25 homolog [Pistacia vera]|uniref:pre-mRNA-splicing factor CWC25 homolog n=1 Tax=Pistacia vera TaxID=55513 RepID=UPI0012634AB7|nr:pre-mRNA-splicing factor CWC25 homolog [Pistacia vera]
MALKFLNKKGWHTGSLRNIENVWKAEQKHDAEEKKLDELRKQIQEERERSEFRLLQEQAGLVPRQERLDFLYDSGLAVGKSDGGGASGSGSGFKALEQPSTTSSSATAKQQSSAPGALFEDDKPHSAGDAWRKLHSDPLLLIRQREQEALARVKNNPVKMALIRKSVEETKHKDKPRDKKKHKKKHRSSSKYQKHSSSGHQSDSEDSTSSEGERPGKSRSHKSSNHADHYHSKRVDSRDELSERRSNEKNHHSKRVDSGDGLNERRSNGKNRYKDSRYREQSPSDLPEPRTRRNDDRDSVRRNHDKSKHERYSSDGRTNLDADKKGRENRSSYEPSSYGSSAAANRSELQSHHKRRNVAPKLSEEELAARLREMQENAELHEEHRWKRLRKAEENDAREATRDGISNGKNFLDAAQKSVYGAEKGGSSTIEERVRRRTYYSQGRSEASEGNAFRR